MALPPSFLRDGFVSPEEARRVASPKGRKLRRLMIGTDGPSDSGKTEFALSAPGPGMMLCLDRGLDGVLDNPNPPEARNLDNFAAKIIKVPLPTQMTVGSGQGKMDGYLDYWKAFYEEYKKATDNPDCRTVIIDGDSDSWELQKLAEFGRVIQVAPISTGNVKAARRAMYARAYDSGKIIIATNKVKDEYEDDVDEQGKPVKDAQGKIKQHRTGDIQRQGFPDQDYLFMIQLRHLYKPAHERQMGAKTIEVPAQFGIRITKCKSNTALVGQELWGEDCNFKGLVQHVYPNISLEEWGF